MQPVCFLDSLQRPKTRTCMQLTSGSTQPAKHAHRAPHSSLRRTCRITRPRCLTQHCSLTPPLASRHHRRIARRLGISPSLHASAEVSLDNYSLDKLSYMHNEKQTMQIHESRLSLTFSSLILILQSSQSLMRITRHHLMTPSQRRN